MTASATSPGLLAHDGVPSGQRIRAMAAILTGIGLATVCGAGFGFFQAPNMRAIMMSSPPSRSGGASGIVATARLLGQTTGAALVAACFAVSEAHGPALALALGGAFAGFASVMSFLRLAMPKLASDPPRGAA